MEPKKRGRPRKEPLKPAPTTIPIATIAQNREKIGKKPRGPGRKFQPGNNANPGGRPKIPEEVVAMCRAASPRAISELIAVFDDPQARPGDKIRSSEVLLNRAWGTPMQSVEITTPDDGPFGILNMSYADALARLAVLRAENEK